jgi:hypothetical protein
VTRIAIVGGGPAGLMAAEALAGVDLHGVGLHGVDLQLDLYDAMPSVGRKFLLAGKGGLNLTHSEGHDAFLSRYGARRAEIEPLLDAFGPDALRAWAEGLGIATFVGSSGRVFPREMKAAPLLRAWLHRLRASGVRIHMRHRWLGWNEDQTLRFATPHGEQRVSADAQILALGGGSWAKLGSDGAWVALLRERGIDLAPLKPANCGFDIGWSEHFSSRHAGQPLKTVVASCLDGDGQNIHRQGECVITETGIEGSLIYALAAPLRDRIETEGSALLHLDLAPGKTLERVTAEVAHPRGARSLSSHLQSRVGIAGVKAALLREVLGAESSPEKLAAAIKALPLKLLAPRPLDEAISSAGGVRFEALDEHLMLRDLPGVFCAGEMLDWEAPTGGYLLTACCASGRAAGLGAMRWLAENGQAQPLG